MELPNQNSPEWHASREDFRHALKVGIKAINSVARTQTDKRGKVVDGLMLRSLLAGMSLNQLLEPVACGDVPRLSAPDPFTVGILARAIAETRLVMFSFAHQKASSGADDLRMLWWEWHEVCEQIRTRKLIRSLEGTQLDSRKESLAKAIREHASLSAVPDDLRSAFSNGKRPRRATFEKLPELAALAGVNSERFDVMYQLSSASAHCEPAVVSLLTRCEPTDAELVGSLNLHIREAAAFLAFTTSDYAGVFPKARLAFDERFEQFTAVWSGVFAKPF